MDRISLVVALAFFFSSASLSAAENRDYDEFRYALVSYQETGFDGVKPTARAAGYDRLDDDSVAIEEKSMDEWLDGNSRNPEAGIGVGIAPFFDSYGVFRTTSSQKKPTYITLGYVSDELFLDDATPPDGASDSQFSFGFGVKDASYSFEYMMSVDDGDYGVSTIGMSFVSEF